MKILPVTMSLARRGGASTFSHALPQELINIGYTVSSLVAGFELEDYYAREIRRKGVPESLMSLGFVAERERFATLVDTRVVVTPRFCDGPTMLLVHHVTTLPANPEAREIAEDTKECYP